MTDYTVLNEQKPSLHDPALCQEIIQFCAAQGVRHVLSFSFHPDSALTQALRRHGLHVVSCSLGASTAAALCLDPAQPALPQTQRLHATMRERAGSGAWLVLALDVLERVDPEHLACVLEVMHGVANGPLIASICACPPAPGEGHRAILMPMPSWLAMFRVMGFRVDDEAVFALAQSSDSLPSSQQAFSLRSHWVQSNPWRCAAPAKTHCIQLAVSDGVQANAAARLGGMLDVGYRQAKRLQFDAMRAPRVGLNVHHIQDFVLMRPLLDVMRRGQVVVLARTTVLGPEDLCVVQAYCERCGIRLISYAHAEEIPWPALALQWLLSGGESTVAAGHILSRQTIEAAKLHGIATVQLQHGIWVEAFAQRTVRFGSQTVLSWGREYPTFFAQTDFHVAGRVVHGTTTGAKEFLAVGSPKFCDVRLPASDDVLRWRLGIDRSAWRRVVLLGTNLHWNHHHDEKGEIHRQLAQLIASSPEIFFIVKLHPSERAWQATALQHANALVLDDIALGTMDLHISRLLLAVDVVVSSLSTLLLDAAVAGKPCIQYDTHNDFSYTHMTPVPIGQLGSLLREEKFAVNQAFAAHYADAADQPFYEHLEKLLARPSHFVDDPQRAASFYSVAETVAQLLESDRHWHAVCAEQARDLNALRSQFDALQTQTCSVQGASATGQRPQQRVQQERSWHLASPLRRLRNWMRQ